MATPIAQTRVAVTTAVMLGLGLTFASLIPEVIWLRTLTEI
jgi:hypothetical protein